MSNAPKMLFHKVLGGYAGFEPDVVNKNIEAIMLAGLVPQVATAYNLLVPIEIREVPIVWLSEDTKCSYDVLTINTAALNYDKLYPLDISDVAWWVYTGVIPIDAIRRGKKNGRTFEET